MSIAQGLLLAAIRGYKRHVSPRKGFACAYRVHVGGCSCSTLGLRAISRHGAWRGLGVLRLRLAECRRAAEALRRRPFIARSAQAGFVDCDLPCDASCIELPSCGMGDACAVDTACEALSCLDCGDCGGWGSSTGTEDRQARRRRRRGEPVVGQPAPDVSGMPAE